jgi:hypothetical protein
MAVRTAKPRRGLAGQGIVTPSPEGALPGLRRGWAAAGQAADADAKLNWLDRSTLTQQPRHMAGVVAIGGTIRFAAVKRLAADLLSAQRPAWCRFNFADT